MRESNVADRQEKFWSSPRGKFAGADKLTSEGPGREASSQRGKNLKIGLTAGREFGFLNKRPHFRAAPIQVIATKSVVFSTALTVN